MTNRQIEAADVIIKHATVTGVLSTRILDYLDTNEAEDGDEARDAMKSAAILLQDEGLIEIIIDNGKHAKYRLKPLGVEIQSGGKSYRGYLETKKEKSDKQSEKEKVEWQRTLLQVQELEIKLKSLESMQEEQRKFWQSGLDRDERQKWQFWWTWRIAGAALIMSVLAFIKSVIIG